jgi:adenylate cyclase
MAAIGEGKFEDAVACFAKGSQINPRHSVMPFFHAIALALMGQAEKATISVQRGLELEPRFRIRVFSEYGMAPPLAEKFMQGARLLGLPE